MRREYISVIVVVFIILGERSLSAPTSLKNVTLCGTIFASSALTKAIKTLVSSPQYTFEMTLERYLSLNVPNKFTPLNEDTLYQSEILYRVTMIQAMAYARTKQEAVDLTTAKIPLPKSYSTRKCEYLKLPVTGLRIHHWLESNYKLFFSFSHESTKTIGVVFRGTNNISNLNDDLKSRLVKMNRYFYENPVTLNGHFNEKCSVPNTDALVVFKGFNDALPKEMLESIVHSLLLLRKAYPNYAVTLIGHSFGGVQAMLAAIHLSMFYHESIPLTAVFTLGQPPVGLKVHAEWAAQCIGPQKVIRMVSSNDIVPFARYSAKVRHPDSVNEVYAPVPKIGTERWIVCEGGHSHHCSYGQGDCKQKNWNNHSKFAGLFAGRRILLLAKSKERFTEHWNDENENDNENICTEIKVNNQENEMDDSEYISEDA